MKFESAIVLRFKEVFKKHDTDYRQRRSGEEFVCRTVVIGRAYVYPSSLDRETLHFESVGNQRLYKVRSVKIFTLGDAFKKGSLRII